MSETNKMLIDATHPEETRVVVLKGNRVEEFDYESANKKQLRGNIYLAKVTRVEPSLQAAFVDYGGNRHGFLAFSDIHPDYYQIPVADRQALLAEDEQDYDDEGEADGGAEPSEQDDGEPAENGHANGNGYDGADNGDAATESTGLAGETLSGDDPQIGLVEPTGVEEIDTAEETDNVEEVGSEDAMEEVPVRRRRNFRAYKIQEVIKRRQILLVQVVKEERGNKGAALTTYLSLAGRYTVLMPNTDRGGGISRKITNAVDRKRLKEIATELNVPQGMGLIVRTAGASRPKDELKRDFEYLLRLWDSVRDMTLRSTAPALVYEEGNLIKRSIRDLYTKDVGDIVVAGKHALEESRAFMAMLMPSQVTSVVEYQGSEPLFTRFQIERQLSAMYSPYVTLRSGGYIVINQTEALVSVDVNSGKSTREHSIEETALNTNMEAASEIARQLRLRDLAGLIVIDFIDMEERRNNRSVERRLKEALKNDRARIQVGRISHFGLLEMSRQRLRSGVLEGTTSQCPHCQGSGVIRSTESVALSVLRAIEDALVGGPPASLTATTSVEAALYILNNKRAYISDIERRHAMTISILASDRMHGANFSIDKTMAPQAERKLPTAAVQMEWAYDAAQEQPAAEGPPREGDGRRKRRRRRGRGRGERGEGLVGAETEIADQGNGEYAAGDDAYVADVAPRGDDAEDADSGDSGPEERRSLTAVESEERSRRRRRGRRGGRRNRRTRDGEIGAEGSGQDRADRDDNADMAEGYEANGEQAVDRFVDRAGRDVHAGDLPPFATAETRQPSGAEAGTPTAVTAEPGDQQEPAEARTEEPRRRRRVSIETPGETIAAPEAPLAEPVVAAEIPQAPVTRDQPEERIELARPAETPAAEPAVAVPEEPPPAVPPRRGWWQRRMF
jgi:ribonuclease E